MVRILNAIGNLSKLSSDFKSFLKKWMPFCNYHLITEQTSANNSNPIRYSKNEPLFGQYSGSNSRLNSGLIFDSGSTQIPLF